MTSTHRICTRVIFRPPMHHRWHLRTKFTIQLPATLRPTVALPPWTPHHPTTTHLPFHRRTSPITSKISPATRVPHRLINTTIRWIYHRHPTVWSPWSDQIQTIATATRLAAHRLRPLRQLPQFRHRRATATIRHGQVVQTLLGHRYRQTQMVDWYSPLPQMETSRCIILPLRRCNITIRDRIRCSNRCIRSRIRRVRALEWRRSITIGIRD